LKKDKDYEGLKNGIMTGDLLHIVEDKIGSFLKKYK